MKPPYPVVLASASPRRRELLRQIISEFTVMTSDVEEAVLPGEPPRGTAERLAKLKARLIQDQEPNSLVIGGDTVVALEDGTQLAKPEHPTDAARMLRLLSGKTHSVITGICLAWPRGEHLFSEETLVQFRTLTEDEIKAYVDTGEPMDKAGAYAIQGGAETFVRRIEGSWSNVVGLPVEALSDAMKRLGLDGCA